MAKKHKAVDRTLQNIWLEIDELAKLGGISETLRLKARQVAETEWKEWTCMTNSEMVDQAISLARVS